MRSLRNLKKCVLEIAQILAQDDILCRLLVNDSDNALDEVVTGIDLNDLIDDNYICMFPPVENRIEDYGRNTFITILLDEISFLSDGQNNLGTIIIYTSTNADHLLLANNKNRLLEMNDRVAQLLDGKKLSSAGTLRLQTMLHTMLSEFHAGYRIRLTIVDQESGKAEI